MARFKEVDFQVGMLYRLRRSILSYIRAESVTKFYHNTYTYNEDALITFLRFISDAEDRIGGYEFFCHDIGDIIIVRPYVVRDLNVGRRCWVEEVE